MTATLPPRAGKIDDIRREDDSKGLERDDDAYHQLGQALLAMADTEDARIPAGRRARRTLTEMAPGYIRPPLLSFTTLSFRAAEDACGLCGWWNCRCNSGSAAVAQPSTTGTDR